MKTKHFAWILGIALALTAGYFAFGSSEDAVKSDILLVTPEQGPFEVGIQATGELKAKNSIKIRGSQAMRSVGVWQTSIKELIPEGTIVEKGDFVASLDKTELANKITERTTDIEREQTKLEQMQIDTAIQMKDINDQIGNILFNMEQERLEIERNKYEPQMVIDQSLLKLKNSERSLDQLENGMLIYEKTWNGKKTVGAQISGWDPVVAELPSIPIDALQNDSLDYIWVKNGSKMRKQEVVVGPANEDHIIILAGLQAGDKVSLKEPSDAVNYEFTLIADTDKAAAKKQIKEWTSAKDKYDTNNEEKAKERSPSKTDKDSGGGGFIIMG